MNIDRFKVLLDGYGADPTRWPAAERAAAEAFARTSPEAASLMAAARALDGALACLPPAAPVLDPVAVAAAASAAPQHRARQPRRSGFGFGFAWPNFAGLAAAMAVGFVVGWNGIIEPLDTSMTLADASPLSTTEEMLTW
jgi:hypothetical protein